MGCSWAFHENKELIFVAKVKNGFVPRIRDDLITDSRSTDLEQPGIRFRPGRGHQPIERYEYASESQSSECGQGEERFCAAKFWIKASMANCGARRTTLACNRDALQPILPANPTLYAVCRQGGSSIIT